MVLQHTVLLVLLATLYACSALRFSVLRRESKHTDDSGLFLKEESNNFISIASDRWFESASLLLADNKLDISIENVLICIGRGEKVASCYQTSIADVPLFPSDLLLIGIYSDKNDSLKGDTSSHLLFDTDRELFIVLIEEDAGLEKETTLQEKESKKRKNEQDDASTGDSDDNSLPVKRPPKKVPKLKPSDIDSDAPKDDQPVKTLKIQSLDDNSGAVKKPKQELVFDYPPKKQPLFDLPPKQPSVLDFPPKQPTIFGFLPKLRFEVIPRKPFGNNITRIIDDRTLELKYNGSIHASARIEFMDSETVKIEQRGGGLVIVTGPQGIKDILNPRPFKDESYRHVALDGSHWKNRDNDYKVEIGDIFILLVPTTSKPPSKSIDWSFAGIESNHIQSHFNSLSQACAADGIKVLCADVMASPQ